MMSGIIKKGRTLLHVFDVQCLFADELLIKFEEHGEIIGFFLQRIGAIIDFENTADARAAFLAEGGGEIKINWKSVTPRIKKRFMQDHDETFIPQVNQSVENQIDVQPCHKNSEDILDNQQEHNKKRLPFLTRVANRIKSRRQRRRKRENKRKLSANVNTAKQTQKESSINELGAETHVDLTQEVESNSGSSRIIRNAKIPNRILGSNIKFFNSEQLFESIGPLTCRILINQLNRTVEHILMEKFKSYGNIEKVHVPNCFAFIQYASRAQAEAAVKARQQDLLFGIQYSVTHFDETSRSYIAPNRTKGMKRKRISEIAKPHAFKKSRLENSECQVIVTCNTDLELANLIVTRLEEFGLTTALFLCCETKSPFVLRDITEVGGLYAIYVNQENFTLIVLHEERWEHQENLSLEEILTFMVKDFIEYMLNKQVSVAEISTQTETNIMACNGVV